MALFGEAGIINFCRLTLKDKAEAKPQNFFLLKERLQYVSFPSCKIILIFFYISKTSDFFYKGKAAFEVNLVSI